MNNILVTGGTGFIGSHLTELLLHKGYAVSCLVRDRSNLRWLSGLDVEVKTGDCLQKETLAEAVKQASLVVHAAGLTKARRTAEYYAVNHIGTRNILEACARHNPGIRKFVLLSSLAAAGPGTDGIPVKESDPPHPVSDYGKSKLLAEEEALSYKDKFPVVVIRPPAVYGPRDRDTFELFRWAVRGVTLEIGGGERFLNFCYVGDLVNAIALALEKQTKSGSIYYAAEKQRYSWADFKKTLLAAGGVKARTLKIPYAAAYLIGLLSEAASLFASGPSIVSRQKVFEAVQKYWVCDPSAAKKDLGFEAAFSLQQGLDTTWRWYRDNNWI